MPTARKHLPAPPLAVGTEADWYARTALAPESIAAATVLDLADPGTYQNLDLPTLLDQLRDHGDAVMRGDMTLAKRTLAAHLPTLQALLARLLADSVRALTPRERETLLKLALRTQAQCVTTIEVLAALSARQDSLPAAAPVPVEEPVRYGQVFAFPSSR